MNPGDWIFVLFPPSRANCPMQNQNTVGSAALYRNDDFSPGVSFTKIPQSFRNLT